MEVGKSIVVRRTLYPDIVDPDLFVCLQIVVYDHSTCAYDCHITNFPRLEPTALDGGKPFVTEREGDVGYILDARGNVGVTLAINRQWKFSKNMQDDRDVMRGEIPGDVDVLLKQAQVEAS
jgi:hypothetical protein